MATPAFSSLFDAVQFALSKLSAQGERCIGEGTQCAYINEKGQHCIVGWMVSPELYEDNELKISELLFRNAGVTRWEPEDLAWISPDAPKFEETLISLQNGHDSWVPEKDTIYASVFYALTERINTMRADYETEFADEIEMCYDIMQYCHTQDPSIKQKV